MKNPRMNKMFEKFSFFSLARIFFYLFFAFLPFQIDALVVMQDVYISGFFNPYSSHFIYLTDVFLLISLVLLSLSFVFREKVADGLKFFGSGKKSALIIFLYVGVFLVLNFVSLLSSVDSLNTLLNCVRLSEFVIVFLFVRAGFVDIKKLLYVFIGVVSAVAFIGIFQYVFQESLGLRFLGEPVISSDKLGVAKVGVADGNFLRIYGTFSHPNIFAGYLSFAIFFIIYCFKDAKVLFSTLFLVCSIAFVLTFSRSAFLAMFVGLFLYYVVSNVKISFRNVVLWMSLILFFIVVFDLSSVLLDRIFIGDAGSFDERSIYFSASKSMFFDNIFGVGLGNFTLVLQEYVNVKLQPWLIQPVHNIFLLVFNEIGVLGGMSFIALFVYLFSRLFTRKDRFSYVLMSLWAFIIVVGFFDHYFVSLYHGNALFWLYVGLVGSLE